MSRAIRVYPCDAVDASIRPPGSKSITNRALVCAALAEGTSRLDGVLASDDTRVMVAAWRQLGVVIDEGAEADALVVHGCGGRLPQNSGDLFIGNSGTTIRFLTAALATCEGRFRLDGVRRMRERPIGDLIAALKQIGGDVVSLNRHDAACPPVEVRGAKLKGGQAKIAGNLSSQFLSGLMLAAPMAVEDVRIEVSGELVSIPYVVMTKAVMEAFGAEVTGRPEGPLEISSSAKYRGTQYAVEPDASAASYFWAAAAIAGGRARVQGLNRGSLQGDVKFCDVLEKMGCDVTYGEDYVEVSRSGALRGIDVNMADISDTVQTLAAVALQARGETVVRGVAHNRVKETDRIADLATELRKFGADVREFQDGLAIRPPLRIAASAPITTYDDHRMAMSMALVGLAGQPVEIEDPACTAKTYPDYWKDLASFTGARLERLE